MVERPRTDCSGGEPSPKVFRSESSVGRGGSGFACEAVERPAGVTPIPKVLRSDSSSGLLTGLVVRVSADAIDLGRAATGSITLKALSKDAIEGLDEDGDFDWSADRRNHLEKKPIAQCPSRWLSKRQV
jgi:hypothetical protein